VSAGAAAARLPPLGTAAGGGGTTVARHALLGVLGAPDRGGGAAAVRRRPVGTVWHRWGGGRGTSCARPPSLAATVVAATVVAATVVAATVAAGVNVTATSAAATGAFVSATVVVSVPATTTTTVASAAAAWRRRYMQAVPVGCRRRGGAAALTEAAVVALVLTGSPSTRRVPPWRRGGLLAGAVHAAAHAAAVVGARASGLLGRCVGLWRKRGGGVGGRCRPAAIEQVGGALISRPMAPKVDGNKRMRLLHELLLSLLGANTSSLPLDVVELVAALFRILNELKVRVPSLKTHVDVSGVSKATGQSFFVIIRDDALDKNGSAKRVIRSVYTYLHGEASMLTTASAWEQSRDDDAGAPARALPPGVSADGPADTSASAAAAATGLPVAATGGVAGAAAASASGDPRKPAGGRDGDDPERPPALPRFGPELDALNFDPEGDAAAAAVVAGGTLPRPNPPAVGGQDAPLAPRLPPSGAWQLVMAPRYEKPTLHRPTPAAKLYIEALFDASTGFAGVLRSTMAKVRLKVLLRHGLASNASIMQGLHWWPKAFPLEVLATLGMATIGPKDADNKVEKPESVDADGPKEGQPPESANIDAPNEGEPPASGNTDAAKEGEPPASGNTDAAKEGEQPATGNTDAAKEVEMPVWANADTPKESEPPAVADALTTKKGNAVSKCTYEVFPVLMEKRHLPTNERARDALDTESVVVHLSQIGVVRQPGVCLVATALTLLFDKEPCVKGVMDAKLGKYSEWVDLDDAVEEEHGLKGGDGRTTYQPRTCSPPASPRTPSTSTPPKAG